MTAMAMIVYMAADIFPTCQIAVCQMDSQSDTARDMI